VGIRALTVKSVGIDLEAYSMDSGGYHDKPKFKRKIRTDVNPFGGRGPYFPVVLLGDMNGDGYKDLMVGKNRDELNVFIGVPGSGLFLQQPQTIAVALPDNERNIRLVDINKDGKQDLLIHYASIIDPNWVTVMITR